MLNNEERITAVLDANISVVLWVSQKTVSYAYAADWQFKYTFIITGY